MAWKKTKLEPAPPKEPRVELPKELRKALIEQPVGIDSQALLASLVRIWGGPEQLALSMHQEFQSATQGGMTRQRILEMMQRLIINNTEHELSAIRRPTEMTDEELNAYALRYMNKVLKLDATGQAEAGTGQTP